MRSNKKSKMALIEKRKNRTKSNKKHNQPLEKYSEKYQKFLNQLHNKKNYWKRYNKILIDDTQFDSNQILNQLDHKK